MDNSTPDDHPKQPRALSRRTLLQAAMLSPAALPMAREVAAQGTPGSGGGAGAHATPAAPPAPTPTPIDPSTMETWVEPWVWRPGDWPGQQLELNVVENENPGEIVGFGNPSAILFSYNGATPGPTIRMRGDETLLLRLRNMLGLNYGSTYVGPYPDPKELPENVNPQDVNTKAQDLGQYHPDYCLGEHVNGTHATRTTNLHTHGLHVRPGRNPDGTHSDNVILRLIDSEDLEMREAHGESPGCSWLRDPEQITYLRDADEVVGFADYEFHIGDVQSALRDMQDLPPQPHPPGTHWYHPHCHGATHNQVASGMAGFLIIEGDVDTAINLALAGERRLDPEQKTGSYDYRERLMLIQRVFLTSTDADAHAQDLKPGGGGGGTSADVAINGDSTPMIINMRPGAIERWRVLNGSADGQSFQHVMVLKGQYAVIETTPPNAGTVNTLVKQQGDSGDFAPASRAEVEADKAHLYQLAFDGITLMEIDGDTATYTIQDLAEQNAGTESPLDRELTGNPNQAMLANYEACFADADSVRNAYVRPNEVYMGPGNRTDLFFKAPSLDGAQGQVYTVISRGAVLHSDTFQSGLQYSYTDETYTSDPQDVVVAYVIVAEEEAPDGSPLPPIEDFDVMSLIGELPPVPEYLLPITDEDLRVESTSGGAATPAAEGAGMYRTHTITYSGWGSNDYPLVTTEGDSETARNFRAFVERDQQNGGNLELLRYAKIADSDEYVLLPANARSMAISGSTSTEVIDDSDPLFPITANMARKFNPSDPRRPQVLVDTAEEWALNNASSALWADISQKPLGQMGGHYPGQPLTRAEGQARFAKNPSAWRLQTKGVDHPFHMHQNPFLVLRVEVPDENGNLVNILDRPRWQDVVWIPRSGGRVVFRARFPDYVGVMVNHCHILLHEDHGMMQAVEITPFADHANPELKDRVTALDDSPEAVSEIYPPLDPVSAWRQSMQFVDPNHHGTGQTFPGFVLGDPPTG